MKANAIRQRGGLEFPKRLVVVGKNPGAVSAPEALQHIDGLRSLNLGVEQLCGIYFLCLDNEVVYVGQSICVVMRVLTHMNQTKDKKMFDHDRVFFLSVPREALDKMEREFIRALKPRYNLNGGGTGRRWEGDGCTV